MIRKRYTPLFAQLTRQLDLVGRKCESGEQLVILEGIWLVPKDV